MAKRMTQFYTKQSQTSFSKPVKIGSSAQYITMEDGNEEAETLKSYCDRIGDPNDLTENQSETTQKKTLINILNETTSDAKRALNFTETGLTRTSLIGFTELPISYPTISTTVNIPNFFRNVKAYIENLRDKKLDIAGGTLKGDLYGSNYYIGASPSNDYGIGIRGSSLCYRDNQGIISPFLTYNKDNGLVDTSHIYEYNKTTSGNNFIEYYKYGDGRLVTNIKRTLSVSLNLTKTVNSVNYTAASYRLDDYPISYIEDPVVTYSVISPSNDSSKISTYSLTPVLKTDEVQAKPGTFQVISLCNAANWSGTVIVRAEGRWK